MHSPNLGSNELAGITGTHHTNECNSAAARGRHPFHCYHCHSFKPTLSSLVSLCPSISITLESQIYLQHDELWHPTLHPCSHGTWTPKQPENNPQPTASHAGVCQGTSKRAHTSVMLKPLWFSKIYLNSAHDVCRTARCLDSIKACYVWNALTLHKFVMTEDYIKHKHSKTVQPGSHHLAHSSGLSQCLHRPGTLSAWICD